MLMNLRSFATSYSQPDFYHFNEDSIKLADYVCREFQNKLQQGKKYECLDLCCGCGVIGIEIILGCGLIFDLSFDFLDIENDFFIHLQRNAKEIIPVELKKCIGSIFINDFNVFSLNKKYSLIVCNPPYYFLENSRISKNSKRTTARFWHKQQIENLINFFNKYLVEEGVAFVVIPKNIIKHFQVLCPEIEVYQLEKIAILKVGKKFFA